MKFVTRGGGAVFFAQEHDYSFEFTREQPAKQLTGQFAQQPQPPNLALGRALWSRASSGAAA
jgi:hypothetical protein